MEKSVNFTQNTENIRELWKFLSWENWKNIEMSCTCQGYSGNHGYCEVQYIVYHTLKEIEPGKILANGKKYWKVCQSGKVGTLIILLFIGSGNIY